MLADAVASRMTIVPYYKIGNGNMRCLVGFTLTRDSFLEEVL
ncbi:MAG TPA: hypothetical protein VIS07_22985 [Candidatus Binatia bacterium]